MPLLPQKEEPGRAARTGYGFGMSARESNPSVSAFDWRIFKSRRVACAITCLLSLALLSGCVFRLGGRPDISTPSTKPLRIVIDPSGDIEAWAREFFGHDSRFVIVEPEAVSPTKDGPAPSCFAEGVRNADLVVLLESRTRPVDVSHPHGRSKLDPFPNTGIKSVYRSGATITVTFSKPGECRTSHGQALANRFDVPRYSRTSAGSAFADYQAAEDDGKRRLPSMKENVPALIDSFFGLDARIVVASGDSATIDRGRVHEIRVGDIFLLQDGEKHLGTTSVSHVDEMTGTVVSVSGQRPTLEMHAVRSTSNKSVELAPTFGFFSRDAQPALGFRGEWYGPILSPLCGVELDLVGGPMQMLNAHVGYLWEPYPRAVGLYGRLGGGAVFGKTRSVSPDAFASFGAKLHTFIAVFDLETGYVLSPRLDVTTLDVPRTATMNGPFARLGFAFDVR